MKKQDWLLNRNQGYITLSAFLFAVALLLTSLLARNNINFINYFYACVDTLLAFVVTGVLAWLWRSIRADRINVSIIAWLFFGFLLWAVAEGIWAVLAIVEGEIPYPSIADYFFIVGYIPFYVALIKRYRSFHIRPTFRQRIYIFAAVSIVSAVTIIFILLPIIRSFDVQDLFVSFLNLFYPLGDLALLLLVVAVFNILQEGRFSLPWQLTALGFLLFTFSDSCLSYASLHELYYPENSVNALTLIIEYTYAMAYLVMLVGFRLYLTILRQQPAALASWHPVVDAQRHYLVCTDAGSKIVMISEEVREWLSFDQEKQLVGASFAELFGVESEVLKRLNSQLIQEGRLANQPFMIKVASGETVSAWLSALPEFGSAQIFTGANIVISVDTEATPEGLLPNPRMQAIISHILRTTGANEGREIIIAHSYFAALVKALYALVARNNGTKVAHFLAERCNDVSRQGGWMITLQGEEVHIPDHYSVQDMARAFPQLLEVVKNYAIATTSVEMVDQELSTLDRCLDDESRRVARQVGLAGNAVSLP